MKMKFCYQVIFLIVLSAGVLKEGNCQRNSGIFYTTILTKTGPYKRLSGFGDAKAYFLKDVNGDGKDDAVKYQRTGDWYVALSDGTLFGDATKYLSSKPGDYNALMGDVNGDGKQDAVCVDAATGRWYIALSDGVSFKEAVLGSTEAVSLPSGAGAGSTEQFLSDVNGDGKADAVVFSRTGGAWYVGLSNGVNSFGAFSPWLKGFGEDAGAHFLADVNGDGKADAVSFDKTSGAWKVALSEGARFANGVGWRTGFGKNADAGLVYDVDRDGRADIISYNDGNWTVCYSSGAAFDASADHKWVTGNRPATINSRSNKPVPEARLIGSVSGVRTGACAVSAGDWLILENNDKKATVDATQIDNWDAWGNDYTPQLPGHEGIYDAGDTAINDEQIRMIHDAGFTYIMLDITNGKNEWVDGRGRRLIERIQHWNRQLHGQQHKMYFCISMGGSRSLTGQAAADVCEEESKRTWDEFYVPYQDAYYRMNGKPLLIHFVWEPENSRDVQQHSRGLVNYNKFTIRWMYNKILDSPAYANGYGWPVLNRSGNPVGKEVMDVMPGFWNGSTAVARDQGEFYRSLWLRVLQYKPQSVWLNSFNETWEHTCVEPSYMDPSAPAEFPDILRSWTDYHGQRMDDFYWVMTKQYNRLYMYNELFRGCYVQEDQSSMIYVVKEKSIEPYGVDKPSMAPVLLVPKGFVRDFRGKVIDEAGGQTLAPIAYDDIRVGGELETRALKNYDRLETDIYTPAKVFPAQQDAVSPGWPGDYEGRIILGLTLQAQATHREPRYLSEMIRMIPSRLNAKGYLGPVRDDSISEQQLSGHGWFLRGLCEYYEWKKDPAVKKYIVDIIQNLALPTLGYHKNYPIDPAARKQNVGAASGTIQSSYGKWLLSSDVGCDFIFLDGIVQAYGLFPSAPLKQLIDEITGRFFQMDLVAMRAQTHATLTGLRAVLRYYGITHQSSLLREVEKRYKLYRDLAMTGNYENYNWFERPEWTEPCAIVDSYMLAVQLWQHTGNPAYLEDAHHIYYNALGHTERANGGFGLDNCPRGGNPSLNVMADEAYWCCTMRGGEGMASAIRYNYFKGDHSLVVPFFNNSEASISFEGRKAVISQTSQYPFEGRTELVVKSSDVDQPVFIQLFAPSWVRNPVVRVNGRVMQVTKANGFAGFTTRLVRGQRIEYTFDMQARIQDPVNPEHEDSGYFSIAYGPLLLGNENDGKQEISFDSTPVLTRIAERRWKAGADGVELTPVYHLLDPRVSKESGYSKQVLFHVQEKSWGAKWISTMTCQNITNTWLAYRKTVTIGTKPAEAKARIAADSKYWLWINGKEVVFEGGLKRGPDPRDTYFDEIDIAPYLRQGENTIAVLVWYFGKDGFSHKSSGKAGLLFDCQTEQLQILSDKTWKCEVLDAYQTAPPPFPNFRLSESSLLFDARRGPGFWQGSDFNDHNMPSAMEIGHAGGYPWNSLVRRPTPQWKNSGVRSYVHPQTYPMVSSGDTIVCELPYDAQVTPYFKIDAAEGQKITMATDNYLFYCPEITVRAEYITKKGVQEYESLGWMNGHKMYYFIPKGVKILALGYRETGYNTEFAGSFTSSDPFLNTIWEKARRTLYVNMRDGYMDCPDRERAAWTGDAVNESGQSFYALSPSSHALAKKWLHELIHWQRDDGAIFSPAPAGNWVNELPCQSVTSIGEYGLWNYYLNTGDRQTITDLYDGAKRYLDLWKEDGKGTVLFRRGDWTWGDWGDNIDTVLLYNLLYYTGVKGMHKIALEIGRTADARRFEKFMTTFKESFNRQFWNGKAYRSPGYTGDTDDRVQALAVVTGVAGEEKFPALLTLFQTKEHASPYMEKYVLEAMFRMNDVDEALARLRKRFSPMVNYPGFTTLFEGWGPGKEGFGGGTINHAWSGGALTILSRYLCGIAPVEPGYRTFGVLPQPGSIAHASAVVSSVAGKIAVSFVNEPGKFNLSVTVPKGTNAIVGVPDKGCSRIMLNGQTIWENGQYVGNERAIPVKDFSSGFIKFNVADGEWNFSAIRDIRSAFVNVLDLRNTLPAGHIVQTSAMVFSDMGAWHGYALPASAAEAGGFNGPVLFNDLGLVLSPSFARLSLTLDQRAFVFNHPRQVYYPGMLQQDYTDDGVQVSQSLIFSDARSAVIKVEIRNYSGDARHAGISFVGTLNPHTGLLKADGKKITVQLTKGIFTSEIITDLDIKTTATDTSYISGVTVPVTLASGGTLVIYIRQSNFIDAGDLSRYRPLADADMEKAFASNRQRWDGYINSALRFKTSWLNDPVYRRLAVKSIITLMTNWRAAAGEIRHDGIFPTYNYFDGFWAWDSWKQAAACALFAPELAKNNIRCMFDYQDKEGMIADCVFIDTTRNNYRNTKPPLAAWAVWEIYQHTGDRDFVREMYPKLLAYHAWWYKHRDHDHNGLCEYGSNNGEAKAAAWESGMDNAVRFDSAVLLSNGPAAWSFDQESVDLNSFLYLEKCLLAKMAGLLNDHVSEKELLSAAERLKVQINKFMYDPLSGYYYDIRIGKKTCRLLKGPEGWEPLWTGVATPAAAGGVMRMVVDTTVFNTYLPFPTFQADHPLFDARAYWRGPVWFDQAMFAIEGFRKYGKADVAAALQRKLFQHAKGLLSDGPIGETYDPLTGEGLTAVNFSWSAASILRLLLL